MKKIKMIVTDMDGTLLNQQSEIDPRDLALLKELMAKGIIFTFATGRHPQYINRFVRSLGVNAPVICANGGIIFDTNLGKAIRTSLVLPQAVSIASQFLFANDIPFSIHTGDGINMTTNNPRRQFLEEYNKNVEFPEDKKAVGYLYPGHTTQGVFKISVFCDKKLWLKDKLSEILPQQNLRLAFSGQGLLDITSADAGKGNALLWLAQQLQIEKDEIISFGDNDNDLSMIEAIPHGVAVANAVDSIKQAAEYITLSNQEAGISHALLHKYQDLLP